MISTTISSFLIASLVGSPVPVIENQIQFSPYLQSSSKVDFNKEIVQKLAKEITKDCNTDREKALEIYRYTVKNMKYDYEQLNDCYNKKYEYTASQAIERKSGICYDYSILYAALTRANNIPCKISKGTTSMVDVYHAWNEVFIDGEWINVDSTTGDKWSSMEDKEKYFDFKDIKIKIRDIE